MREALTRDNANGVIYEIFHILHNLSLEFLKEVMGNLGHILSQQLIQHDIARVLSKTMDSCDLNYEKLRISLRSRGS